MIDLIPQYDFTEFKNYLRTFDAGISLVNIIIAVFGVITTAIGIYFAYKIGTSVSKKLSYKSKWVEHEFEQVSKLIKVLDNFSFEIYFTAETPIHSIRVNSNETRYVYAGIEPKNFFVLNKRDYFIKYFDYNVCFNSSSYMKTLSPLLDFNNSSFLPKEIRKELWLIYSKINRANKDSFEFLANKDSNILLEAKTAIIGYEQRAVLYCTIFNSENHRTTFEDYLEMWDSLFNKINDWLKKNEFDQEIELNEKFEYLEQLQETQK